MEDSVLSFLKHLEIEFPFDPAIPLLGIYTKDYKLFYYEDTCTYEDICSLQKTHAHMKTYVHCSTVSNSKDWNQPKCLSTIDWIKKMWHIYTMEYYAAIKKDEFMSFARTWLKLETIILSKPTQEQKTQHSMFSLISGC